MLEAIIASGIIVTAVSSALTLVASSIRASKENETAITAANLAREGVEVARGIRDTDWLKGQPFTMGLSGSADRKYSAIAVFDPAANAWTLSYDVASDPSDAAARVYVLDADSGSAVAGLFLQGATAPSGATPSGYSRIVRTEPVCDAGGGNTTVVSQDGSDCGAQPEIGVHVASTVRWNAGGGRMRTLTAEEDLMDWR